MFTVASLSDHNPISFCFSQIMVLDCLQSLLSREVRNTVDSDSPPPPPTHTPCWDQEGRGGGGGAGGVLSAGKQRGDVCELGMKRWSN